MVSKIELWLNIIHYCFYKAEYKRHMFTNKINPFVLLGRIPRVKRNLEKQGTTLVDVTNKVWTDKRLGFGIMISGGAVVISIFLIGLAIFDITNYLLGYPFEQSLLPFLICIGLAYAFCHLTIFKDDKYIKYFKKLDKRPRSEKRKYAFFTLLFEVGSVALWLYSFRFLPI